MYDFCLLLALATSFVKEAEPLQKYLKDLASKTENWVSLCKNFHIKCIVLCVSYLKLIYLVQLLLVGRSISGLP